MELLEGAVGFYVVVVQGGHKGGDWLAKVFLEVAVGLGVFLPPCLYHLNRRLVVCLWHDVQKVVEAQGSLQAQDEGLGEAGVAS